MRPKISHIFEFISSNYQFTVPPHTPYPPQPSLPTKRKPGARAEAKTPISRNRAVLGIGVVVQCLHNRKLVSRMCVLSFNRAIALYLLFLHALALINTCSELDTHVGLSGTRLTLTVASMCIPPLARRYFRLVHPGTPIRLRFSRSSELMCSVLSHCKVASNRVTAVLQPIEHVGHSVLDRKSPKDSIPGICISFRGPQHVRFLSVRSKLQQISWK